MCSIYIEGFNNSYPNNYNNDCALGYNNAGKHMVSSCSSGFINYLKLNLASQLERCKYLHNMWVDRF